jgi:hypothetical protein
VLDLKLEEKCVHELNWNLGQQLEDRNCRITYNTFLQRDDKRLHPIEE